MVRTSTQGLALWTNQVVGVIGEVTTGHHTGFLFRVDGNVRGDVPVLQQMAKPTIAVAGVTSQRHRLQRETIQ